MNKTLTVRFLDRMREKALKLRKKEKIMPLLIELTPSERIDINMMYASTANVSRINAYNAVGLGARCLISPFVADALQRLIPLLKTNGLKLKIFDAYRPPEAHRILSERFPVKGLFAPSPEQSLHCRGIALDVCLTDVSGKELAFPTNVDVYTPEFAEQLANGITAPYAEELKKAGYDYDDPKDGARIANREFLRSLMEQAGFAPLQSEWWHFQLPDSEKYPTIDFERDAETGAFRFSSRPL